LREGLIPLAERCGQVMREALAALKTLRPAPSQAVERSRSIRYRSCLQQAARRDRLKRSARSSRRSCSVDQTS
jgi:hypothetical protein